MTYNLNFDFGAIYIYSYFIGSEVGKWCNLKKGEIYKNPNIAATRIHNTHGPADQKASHIGRDCHASTQQDLPNPMCGS